MNREIENDCQFVASATTSLLVFIMEITTTETEGREGRGGCIDFARCLLDTEVAAVWESERGPVWRYKLESH